MASLVNTYALRFFHVSWFEQVTPIFLVSLTGTRYMDVGVLIEVRKMSGRADMSCGLYAGGR